MITDAPALRGRIRHLSSVRSRSATIDKAFYLAALHRGHRGDVVLVYSMPKVASSTIFRSIRQSTDRPVLHFHNMTREALSAERQWWREQSSDRHVLWVWRGEYAMYRVKLTRRARPWDVINGVREPIARSLSAFFHMGERAGYLDRTASPEAIDLEQLRVRFIDYFPTYSDWFRTEFLPATGIDVYAEPFDRDSGHAEYENDRFRVLTIRQEDLARIGSTVLGKFLNEDTIELARSNAADQKFYQPLYERFRDEVQLPEALVNEAYASEQARHFYSAAELDGFRERWLS